MTVTVSELEKDFDSLVAKVERGTEVVITRDGAPVAILKPVFTEPGRRPKVGEILDAPFEFPASAFAPLTDEELKEWGL